MGYSVQCGCSIAVVADGGCLMPTLQHYDYNGVDITFYDFDEDTNSVPCHVRAIHIIEPATLQLPVIAEEIANYIRSQQS